MPLYEYQCESCGRRFEALQRLDEPPLESCAECGGKVRKLLSAPAFQFKGSGWYVTDYARSGGAGKGASAADKDESAKSSAAPDKSEAKESSSKGDGGAAPAAPTPSTSPKD